MQALVVFVSVALAAQSALSQHWGGHGHWAGGYAPTGGYHGPLAAPVVTAHGLLADTPEVAAAKAAHLTEVARAASHGSSHGYEGAGYAGYAGGHGGYQGGYHGPLAKPVVTPEGFLADTPEVAAAKAAHLSLVAGAGHGSYGGHGGYSGHGAYSSHEDGSYHGDASYYDDAGHHDDGSYKPHLYEHGHY